MKILAIDSSYKVASAALFINNSKAYELYTDGGQKHSETLLPLIEKLFDKSNLNSANIDIFACTTGPGSFTGTRIAVSVVKGLALPHNARCIGISTLESLAHNALDFDGCICPVLNARRDTYYNAFFTSNSEKLNQICDDRQIHVEDLIEELSKLNKPVILLGDGANACYNRILEGNMSINAKIAPESLLNVKASAIAMIAAKHTNFTTPENLTVKYLHATEAERNINNKS